MAHWLLKTEPSDYSFDNLLREKRVVWSGVSNAAALKNMRAMQPGDELLLYHTGSEKAIVGTATVLKGAYPYPKATNPKLLAIDIAAKDALPRPVTLGEIKKDSRFAQWGLVKIGRLSVVPTTPGQFAAILKMADSGG